MGLPLLRLQSLLALRMGLVTHGIVGTTVGEAGMTHGTMDITAGVAHGMAGVATGVPDTYGEAASPTRREDGSLALAHTVADASSVVAHVRRCFLRQRRTARQPLFRQRHTCLWQWQPRIRKDHYWKHTLFWKQCNTFLQL